MSKRQNKTRICFVIETRGRALLAFLADSIEQARHLCSEDWFAKDMGSYKSGGQPVWDGTTELRIRRAGVAEAAEMQIALTTELVRGEYDGFVFAFLVPLDAGLQ